jgi:hypothetical protein
MYSEIMHIWQEEFYQQNPPPERTADVPSEVELTDASLAFVFGGFDSPFPVSNGGVTSISGNSPAYIDPAL